MKALLCFLIGLLAAPAFAQTIDAGAPNGAEETALIEENGAKYALPVAAFGGTGKPTQAVRGLTRRAAFRLTGDQTTDAVIDGYRRRLSRQGYSERFACRAQDCGGFDFRFGADLMAPPAMLMDVQDFAQLSMQRKGVGFVSILASRVRGAVYIQTITVAPGRSKKIEVAETPAPAIAAPQAPVAALTAPQVGGTLLSRLQANGRVRVAGLSFAQGGATLTKDSAKALEGLAEMLKTNAGLNVAIVGHSDWSGGLDPNIRISNRRAKAVLDALVERGVPRARLESRGIGYLAPLQSNKTDQGRALNRRVELVLKP